MRKFYILLISDIHLGASSCQARALLDFLMNCEYVLLIIVGDLFDEHGGILTDEQFQLVEYLRANRHRIKLVDGNHDFVEEFAVNNVIGVEVHKKYEWQIQGQKFCAIHGYQFDKFCFVFSEPLIDKMFYLAISFLEKMDLQTGYIKGLMDRFHDNFADSFDKKAIRYMRRRHIDILFSGHTHKWRNILLNGKDGPRQYVNLGSWTGPRCSYASVDQLGNVELGHIELV